MFGPNQAIWCGIKLFNFYADTFLAGDAIQVNALEMLFCANVPH